MVIVSESVSKSFLFKLKGLRVTVAASGWTCNYRLWIITHRARWYNIWLWYIWLFIHKSQFFTILMIFRIVHKISYYDHEYFSVLLIGSSISLHTVNQTHNIPLPAPLWLFDPRDTWFSTFLCLAMPCDFCTFLSEKLWLGESRTDMYHYLDVLNWVEVEPATSPIATKVKSSLEIQQIKTFYINNLI